MAVTMSELSHAVYEKHCKGQRGVPVEWIVWMMWARRSVGWMRPM